MEYSPIYTKLTFRLWLSDMMIYTMTQYKCVFRQKFCYAIYTLVAILNILKS